MPALNTDNFTQVAAAGTETTLAAPGKSIGASTINLTSGTGWPTTTGIIFAMRRVDGTGAYVPGTYTEWAGVNAGGVITLNTTPLYGTDQTYAADGLTQVYIPLSYNAWNRVINTILQQHTQAGAHVALTNTGGANFTGGITTDSLVVTGSNVGAGWSALGQTLTYAANNSNKEYTCTAPVDLTSTLSPGMKVQITRNTAPPTQCMSYASGSSQYAKSANNTPGGLTFTAAFTCEAWVYVLSYTTGVIVGRTDTTGAANGWQMYVDSTGRVNINYFSASASTNIQTTMSLPLNRWVHIASVITSVASKTGAIYVNGNSVPTTQTASAATALTQNGFLALGANQIGGTPANFFNGYMSEVRVWATNQTQSAIQSNMAISLTGSESNLASLFQGNGNFNDKTANANNLTATNGPIATQAANPYNSVEYAIVTKVSYSNPTTTVTLFTGTDYNIPNMTLNSAQYSLARTPFGFPSQRGKWLTDIILKTDSEQSSPVQNTWYNIGNPQISAPTGEWRAFYEAPTYGFKGTSTAFSLKTTLSTANNTESDTELTSYFDWEGASGTIAGIGMARREKNLSLSALTTYFLNFASSAASANTAGFRGDLAPVKITFESAYI